MSAVVAPLAVGAVLLLLAWLSARAITRLDLPHILASEAQVAQTDAPEVEPPEDLFPGTGTVARVGLILVHGIGEQTRFEHLESQVRDLVGALQRRSESRSPSVAEMTVEIVSGGVAALHAPRDSWRSGPGASVTLSVRHLADGEWHEARVFVHEVWWADVNEPISLAKQFRFWLWGLAIWAHPARLVGTLGSAGDVLPPHIPNRNLLSERLKLFGAAVFFATIGTSIGIAMFFAKRVLQLQSPRIVQTIANYVSAVKLYNQERRFGAGLLWHREDFLDTIDEPPRVSVRRRMIRAIADVACGNYHRWYVLARSQGSVVTFNGLMETAYSWPGYLDEQRWRRLVRRRMAGPAATGWLPPTDPVKPRRPAWAAPDDVAYRARIFRRCCGWLTYGNPLEKFAALWPALVPISKEPAFHRHAQWFNVYDVLDPVSGRMLAFQSSPASCCPPAIDLGYSAYPWLLATHTHYLTQQRSADDAASQAMHWMLTGQPIELAAVRTGLWYEWDSARRRGRRMVAYVMGAVAWVTLAFAAALILPWFAHTCADVADAVANQIKIMGLR